ncbi:hypothetical protein BDZ88DRAFT_405023 [Geranomyces variabilis]|nr:hypothetical protein BDZ88DRAFT_405023 [Geranomyces variabilis]KAJ3143330.1 hypothetical protein HDU90_000089 [Geranomyces variabilis]
MSGAGTPPDSELSANAVCAGCDNEITGANDEGLINFADSLFHTGCFKCSKCSSQIDFENSVVLIGEDGKAVCVNCSFKCKLCGEPILEEAITTDEDTYHSACFRCSKCQRAIGDYSFFHDDDKLWCTDCHANSVRQGSFDSLKERPLRDSVPRRSRIHSNNELKKDMSKASSLASMPGVSPEEYIAQLERELEERSRQLSNVEATLIKFKSTSKKALEEFRQVNDAHQKECLRRQQAEAKIETLQGQMHSVARADTKRQRSEEDAERLHKEIEFLHMQRSAAQKDIQEISAKKDALVAGIGQLLEARNAQGAPSSPTGQTESSRAQELARELDQIKGRFREEVASLQTQRDTLREEVHALLINRDGLFSEITALQEENRQLEANRARISEALIGSAEHLDALNELGASSASGARYPEMEELERTVSADTMEMKPMPLPPPRAGRPSGPRRDSKGTELSASPLPLKKSDSQEQSLTGPGLKRDKWTKDWKTNVKAAKTKLKNAIPQKTGDGDAASPSSISGMFKIGAKKATSKSDLDLTRIGPPPPKNDIRPTHSFQPHSYRSPRKCDLCADKLWGKEARCEGCGYHCHQKCVPAVVGQCFASSASAGPDSAPATASEHATFGVPLIQLLEQEGGATVPRIVVKCVAAVETRGMTVEGIYRKSGPMTQINRIVAAVDKGEDPDLDDATDITAVTSVLKQFFRDLPEPLLTTAQFKQWTDALRTGPDDQSAKLATISHLLSQLPPAHLTTLAYLILHLDRIQQHSSENLMTPANIGVVFGPGLLRPAHVETQMDLAESSAKNAVVEFLVRNAKALFAVGGSGAGVTQDEDVGAGDAGGRSQAEPDSAADDRPLPPTPGEEAPVART